MLERAGPDCQCHTEWCLRQAFCASYAPFPPTGLQPLYNDSVITPAQLPVIGPPVTCGGDGLFWNATFDQHRLLVNCTVTPSIPVLFTTPMGNGTGVQGTGPLIGLTTVTTATTLNCSSGQIPTITWDQFGRVTMGSCTGGVPVVAGNGTIVFENVAHETTLGVNVTNGTTYVTYGTVQPIDVTSTPTFAGATINGASTFNLAAQTVAPPTLLGSPTAVPLRVTGFAAVPGAPVNTLLTPAIIIDAQNGYATMGMQSRNVDDSMLYWDMYPSLGACPGPCFAWFTSAASVTGAAWYKNLGTVSLLFGAQQGAGGIQTTVSPAVSFTDSSATMLVPTTVQSTFGVTSTTTLAAASATSLTLGTPLGIGSGGTNSGTALGGSVNLMINNGAGAIKEGTTAYLRYFVSGLTISCGGVLGLTMTITFTRAGDTIAYLIDVPGNIPFNPAAPCHAVTTVNGVPLGLMPNGNPRGLCAPGHGSFNGNDATVTACITVLASNSVLVTYYFGDFTTFLPGTNYELAGLSIANSAGTVFT